MSREFGSCNGGYFHEQMRSAADDLKRARDPLSKLWGEFFEEFEDIACAIASSEACDSGPDDPIMETLAHIHQLKRHLMKIEVYLEPFDRVAKEAIREHEMKARTCKEGAR